MATPQQRMGKMTERDGAKMMEAYQPSSAAAARKVVPKLARQPPRPRREAEAEAESESESVQSGYMVNRTYRGHG